MSEWEKKNTGTGGGKFIKFEEGKSVIGVYNGCKERQSPFEEGSILQDYQILTEAGEEVLSSTSKTLLETLKPLATGTKVKIDMVIKKGRKLYDVYTAE